MFCSTISYTYDAILSDLIILTSKEENLAFRIKADTRPEVPPPTIVIFFIINLDCYNVIGGY